MPSARGLDIWNNRLYDYLGILNRLVGWRFDAFFCILRSRIFDKYYVFVTVREGMSMPGSGSIGLRAFWIRIFLSKVFDVSMKQNMIDICESWAWYKGDSVNLLCMDNSVQLIGLNPWTLRLFINISSFNLMRPLSTTVSIVSVVIVKV